MNDEIPKIFINNKKKIDNNKVVFYSSKDNNVDKININVNNKLNEILNANNFIYKKKIRIKTYKNEDDYIIISKNNNYLLTIDGKRIYIDDIIDINN
jgi:hypothetical protein